MSTEGSPSTPAVPIAAAGVPNPTRIVQLDGGQRRRHENNHQTVVEAAAHVAQSVPFEALFFAHYAAIRAMCRELPEPGVAVVAVHVPTCSLAGRLWLRAQVGRPSAAIVGRHSQADLMLVQDEGLSLRHMALVLHPLRSWDGHDARFTVLDLRTAGAFRDETGRSLEGVRCEGPAMLSSGEYALYFLQTGDATDWPPVAGDAWEMLPRRVYLDERSAEPDRWERRAGRRRAAKWDARDARDARDERDGGEARTTITAIRGPVGTDEKLIAEDEEPLGALNVLTMQSARRVLVGPRAASRGILLGRYSRCDAADMFHDSSISRSHLLLVQVEGALYAIDTASTLGSYVDRGQRRPVEFRMLKLAGDTSIALAENGAMLRWHPVG